MNGELKIINNITNDIKWRGKPLGIPIEKILAVEQNESCITLLSSDFGPSLYPGGPLKSFKNVLCLNSIGKILWVAELPSSTNDFYVNILWSKDVNTQRFHTKPDLIENSFVAISASGFLVDFDPFSGKILSTFFIK
jgi:hypothetical protein